MNKEESIFSSRIMRLLWTLFILFLICGFTIPPDEFEEPTTIYRISNWLTYPCLGAIMWIICHRFTLLYSRSRRLNPIFHLFPPILFLICFGLFTGFFYTEDRADYYHAFAWEFVPMITIIFVLLGMNLGSLHKRLMDMLAIQSLLGGLLAVYIMWVYPILEGRSDIVGPHFYAFGLSSICTFTVGYLRRYSPRLQLAVLVGFSSYCYLTLSYQSRGGSFMVFLLLPVAFIATQLREGIKGIVNLRTVVTLGIFLISTAYLVILPETQRQMRVGMEGTAERLFSGHTENNRFEGLQESIDSEIDTSRGAEARDFISQSTFATWLVGRGWGGGWRSQVMAYGSVWNMVHFGPLHLVLKGGVGLMVLYQAVVVAGIFRSWRYVGIDPLASSCFCFLLVYFAGFIKHAPSVHSYYNYITWIVLGIALCCRAPSMPPSPLVVNRMGEGLRG